MSRPQTLLRIPMSHHRRHIDLLLVGIVCAALCGCSLFRDGSGLLGRAKSFASRGSRQLPAIPTSRDAMQLEVMLIERPVGDPLMGDALWNEVDQVGSLEPATRLALSRNGFRVGHTGSEPPRALEEMLELSAAPSDADNSITNDKLIGRRIVLASGGETEVQAGSLFEACAVDIAGGDANESKEFTNARFVFRLKTERNQDGWARIEFLPEIHHGAYQLRRVAANGGWQFKTTQNVHPLYNQRFSLVMNVGEMAIITTGGETPSSVGRHFFLGDGQNSGVQRLLVVRLSDMAKTDPVYSE